MERFIEVFRQAAGEEGMVSFARFVELALYHPETGYYTSARSRVGAGPATDFYTARSVGGVFAELVAAACRSLLPPEQAESCAFVEIGPEPGAPLFDPAAASPFARVLTFPYGRPAQLPPAAIVFSNELFDAQPFHRVRHADGAWRELGVFERDGKLREGFLPQFSPEVALVAPALPPDADEGYTIDLPTGAARLCRSLAEQPWRGLFLAFDYGRSWRELAGEMPAGSARGYSRHRQVSDLLAHPGEQDLTCHVCWDWLEAILRQAGFDSVQVESQESFFVTRALPAIAAIAGEAPGQSSLRKRQLNELLHPGGFGQKFQALSAIRH